MHKRERPGLGRGDGPFSAADLLERPLVRWGLVVLLGCAGAALNQFALPLLSEETPEFLFGGAAVFLAFAVLGGRSGTLVAVLSLLPLAASDLVHVPRLAIVYVVYLGEAWVAYWVYRRSGSLVFGASLYWFTIGWLLDLATYQAVVGLAPGYVRLVLLKQVLNGILSATLAELLLRLPVLRRLGLRGARSLSLRQFVFSDVVLAVLGPSVVLALFVTRTTYERQLGLERDRASIAAADAAHRVELLLDRQSDALVEVARRLELTHPPATSAAPALQTFLVGQPDFGWVELRDPAGRRLAAAPAMAPDDPPGDCPSGAQVVATQAGQVLLCEPLRDGGGTAVPAAFVRGALRSAALEDALLAAPQRWSLSLIGPGGHVLCATSDFPRHGLPADFSGRLERDSHGAFQFYLPDRSSGQGDLGIDLRYAAFQRLDVAPWSVVAQLPAEKVHAELGGAVRQLLAFFGGLQLLLYATVGLLAARLGRPISLMDRAAGDVAEGQLRNEGLAELGAHPIEEVRDLAQHFGAMRHALLYRDVPTGLPNRQALLEQLQALGNARRSRALLHLNLKRFRALAESLGPEATTLLVAAVGRRLAAVAGELAMVARIGADDFAVLLADVADTGTVVRQGEEALEALRRPLELEGRELSLSASAGAAIAVGEESADVLLDRAYTALRESKQTRHRLCLFSPELNQRAHQRRRLEDRLSRALSQATTLAYFQPVVRIADGACVQLEALARWPDAELVEAGTTRVIALAEEADLIAQVDEQVLRTAAAQLVALGAGAAHLRLAVNVSPRRFLGTGLVDDLRRVAQESGLAPDRLVVEITEHAALLDIERSAEQLHRLREQGMRVAIDDFGTGYSSLSHLLRLPADTVKIDRSFLEGLGREAEATAIVTGILGMAKSLGRQVVAEGVETPEQLTFLRRHGCELVQGWLVSPPRPLADLASRLDRPWLDATGEAPGLAEGGQQHPAVGPGDPLDRRP